MRKNKIEKNDLVIYKGDLTEKSEVKRTASFAKVDEVTIKENKVVIYVLELIPSKHKLVVSPLLVQEILTPTDVSVLNKIGFIKKDSFFVMGSFILIPPVYVMMEQNLPNCESKPNISEYKLIKSPYKEINGMKYYHCQYFDFTLDQVKDTEYFNVDLLSDLLKVCFVENPELTDERIISEILGNSYLR